jgi:hypothetical protein
MIINASKIYQRLLAKSELPSMKETQPRRSQPSEEAGRVRPSVTANHAGSREFMLFCVKCRPVLLESAR